MVGGWGGVIRSENREWWEGGVGVARVRLEWWEGGGSRSDNREW